MFLRAWTRIVAVRLHVHFGYDPQVFIYTGPVADRSQEYGHRIYAGRCSLSLVNPVTIPKRHHGQHSAGSISYSRRPPINGYSKRESWGVTKSIFTPVSPIAYILKLKGAAETALATLNSTPRYPPANLSQRFLPRAKAVNISGNLMTRSEAIFNRPSGEQKTHRPGCKLPATGIWLFWSSDKMPALPPFKEIYRLRAAVTTGVDLLRVWANSPV